MTFSLEFFQLQWDFANRMAELEKLPLPAALLRYTYFFLSFGLGRDFNPDDPIWQTYLEGLKNNSNGADWSFRFYLQRVSSIPPRQPENAFGCFSYVLWPGKRVRLHFRNADPLETSPLSDTRLPIRLDELRALFTSLKPLLGDSAFVVGGSWMYHLPAYCRLFPPAYLSSAQPSYEDYPYLALWGQFLDRDQQVRSQQAELFRANLAHATTSEHARQAFPFPLLRLEGKISEFYPFYACT